VFKNTKALVRGDRYEAPLSADTLVWLFRDELATAMDREVEALAVVGGLSRDERAARLETLRAALLEAERREEAAIMRAREGHRRKFSESPTDGRGTNYRRWRAVERSSGPIGRATRTKAVARSC
jgi:hypothetical protein